MNLAHITIVGNVAQQPTRRATTGGVSVTTFRVASTPRVNKGGQWVDGPSTFLTVTCWRQLADNVNLALRNGDPVIVQGRLIQKNYQGADGQTRTSYEIEASAIGHDLSRGVATNFQRNRRTEQIVAPAADEPVAVPVAGAPESEGAGDPAIDDDDYAEDEVAVG